MSPIRILIGDIFDFFQNNSLYYKSGDKYEQNEFSGKNS